MNIHDLTLTRFSAIRIEWCKARARAHRWKEEVELLVEEQRRVLQFLHWQEDWWLGKEVALGSTNDMSLKEGLAAYALRQAAIRRDLRIHFTKMWQDTQRYVELGNVANDALSTGGNI